MKPVSILGGKSIYCINEGQLKDANRLAYEDEETAPRIQEAIEQLESDFSRNERAALAFTLIDRLLKNKPSI
jgi:hypothetical protein